jgi:hypothetical protein
MNPRNRLYHPQSAKIQVCGFISLLRLPVGVVTAFLLVAGFLFNVFLLRFALAGMGLLVVLTVLYFMMGSNLRCAVCTNPVYMSKRCTKNREAKRLLGMSHPMQVAWDALLRGYYRCMYCGERVKTEEELAEYRAFEEAANAGQGDESEGATGSGSGVDPADQY